METQSFDGPYRIVRLIGEGGMGRVYEATHARLAGRYAVKVLLRMLSRNAEAVAMFKREAQITSGLQHPNIVQVMDYNATPDGTEYLVMEYLQGENLSLRLQREGALPVEDVVGIVEQVAAGLAAAHAHGVVHRDLKPENVFLVPIEGSRREWAKILDFGIALIREADGSLGPERVLFGTPSYMSPEQASRPADEVGPAADQFALAVMSYEMLTGRLPFKGNSVEALLYQVLGAEPAPMDLDGEIERVVRRALAKSPEGRFSSVLAFSEALQAAAPCSGRERASTHASTMSRSPSAVEIWRPRRPLRAVAGLALGAALAGLTMSWLSDRAPSPLPAASDVHAGSSVRHAALVEPLALNFGAGRTPTPVAPLTEGLGRSMGGEKTHPRGASGGGGRGGAAARGRGAPRPARARRAYSNAPVVESQEGGNPSRGSRPPAPSPDYEAALDADAPLPLAWGRD